MDVNYFPKVRAAEPGAAPCLLAVRGFQSTIKRRGHTLVIGVHLYRAHITETKVLSLASTNQMFQV